MFQNPEHVVIALFGMKKNMFCFDKYSIVSYLVKLLNFVVDEY